MQTLKNVFLEKICGDDNNKYLTQHEMLLIKKNELSNGTLLSLLKNARVNCRYIAEHDFISAFRDLFDSFTITDYRSGFIASNWMMAWERFSNKILSQAADWSVVVIDGKYHLIAQQASSTTFSYPLAHPTRYSNLVYNS